MDDFYKAYFLPFVRSSCYAHRQNRQLLFCIPQESKKTKEPHHLDAQQQEHYQKIS